MATANASIEAAIITVGLLILERIPRSVLVGDWVVEDHYEAALQEFTDILANRGITFEPPANFRQRTVDHLKWYIEDRGLIR